MSEQTRGVAIRVSYRPRVLETKTTISFESSGNDSNHDQQRKDFGLAVFKKFKKLLNFDDTTCQMCLEHVQELSENSSALPEGYQVMLSMSTYINCYPDVKFLSVLGKTFTVRKNPYGILALEVELVKNHNFPVRETASTIYRNEGSTICALNVQLTSEEICPKIDMNYSRYRCAGKSCEIRRTFVV